MRRLLPRGVARVSVLLLVLTGLAPMTATAQSTEQVNIYMVALGDAGQSGQPIGCDDSLVPVQVQISAGGSLEERVRASLRELFVIEDEYYGQSGLYNALFRSNLFVDEVIVEGGSAIVRLSGDLLIGGVCDEPRVREQIRQTVLQFSEIQGAVILLNGDLLLPAPGPRCFDETGYCISGEFRTFWENNGGLPVFGYPLSDLVIENGRVVQYFERQRFEYHPENNPPYNVLLGLLGRQAADVRGFAGAPAFQPLAGDPNQADCLYFPETQHQVCLGFLSYWQSHGLNYGDEGVSFRESLLLFGYPISEPFTDPVTGLGVQYFERAVFEYHPDNEPQYEVLLDRLGAELYDR